MAVGAGLVELLLVLTSRPALPVFTPGETAQDPAGRVRDTAQTVLDTIVAVRRLRAQLAAVELADIAYLSRHYPALIEQLPNELGCALNITDATADADITLARRLTTDLPHTMAALTTGRIDLGHARAVHDATTGTTPDVAAAVDAGMAPLLGHLVPAEIRERARRRVLRRDPEAARRRHAQARAERGVTRFGGSDGIAGLSVRGPAEDIAVVWHTLTVLAHHAATPDDPRTLGNRRHDTLVDIARHALHPHT